MAIKEDRRVSRLRTGFGRAGVAAWMLVLLWPGAASAAPGAGVVPGKVLVRFKAGVEPATRSDVRADLGAVVEDSLPVRGLQLLDLPAGAAVEEAVSELERDPAVLYAEPNRYRHARVLPNDPLLGRSWGLDNSGQAFPATTGQALGAPDADIDAPEAWDLTTGSPQVTVAIGDSGIDRAHPDLAANVDSSSADFVDGDANPTDVAGHGTRVAGIIGARGNDGLGVAGVSWNARLMALRLGDLSLTSAAAVRSFAYAAARGARVYNGSFGDPTPTRAESDAIAAAPRVLFVFAAANGATSSDGAGDYPCAYPSANIVCVAASSPDDRLAPFSNYGRVNVDLAAPGQGVWSTIPGGGHGVADGTSFATPHVTGVAALYLARYPSATVAELKRAILGGVDVKAAFSSLASGGRLNARNTLAIPPSGALPAGVAAASSPAAPAPDPQPSGGRPAVNGSLSIARRQRLRSIARSGLRPRVSCAAACDVSARLVLDRRTARRRRLPRVIGAGSARGAGPGSVVVSVRLARAARAPRARLSGVRARLVVTLAQASGERIRLVRVLALRR